MPKLKPLPLAHPAALAALLVLLLNDHLLRWWLPSTLTGKVSDFAWLFIAAIGLAWLLSRLLPARMVKSGDRIAWIGFTIIALGFVLGKTQPTFHNWVGIAFKTITGSPIGLKLDSTDLIALIALIPAWFTWKASDHSPLRPGRASWLVISISALLTIANMAQPNQGIENLEIIDQRIVAQTAWSCFISEDGGLSWRSISQDNCRINPRVNILDDPLQPNKIWSFQAGGPIEVSHDDGNTWSIDYTPTYLSQVEEAYIQRTKSGNPDLSRKGPFDVVYDPKSGNLIFAMGYQGILIRTPESEWITVEVFEYKPDVKIGYHEAVSLIIGELILSLAVGMLTISIQSIIDIRERYAQILLILIALEAMLLLGIVIFLPPALSFGYAETVAFPLVALSAIGAAIMVPYSLYRLHARSVRLMWQSVLIALATGLVFATPYVLWILNIIPDYSTARNLALIFAGTLMLSGFLFVKMIIRKDGLIQGIV